MRVLVLTPPSDRMSNVVRDLLFSCWCTGKRIANAECPPTNNLYIATVIKEAGIPVDFIDASAVHNSRKEFIASLTKEYDYIVVSTSNITFKEDLETFRQIKEMYPNTKTILFGSYPTFFPKKCLKKPEIDFVVFGDAEYAVRDIVSGKNLKDIPGIGFKQNKTISIDKKINWIANLDDLPFPDRTMLPKDMVYFHPLVERLPWTTAITSRGCGGKCIFCISPVFFGKYRERSAKNVVDEIEYLMNLGFKEVFYRDETFTMNRRRNIQICEEIIKRKLDITWLCNARIGTMNKEIIQLMKKAGCHTLKIGVESGSQKILDNLRKGITLDMTRKTLKDAREVGIKVHAHLMIGCPGETQTTIKDTMKFLKEIKPSTVTYGIMTPYPGTPIFDFVAKKLGYDAPDGTEWELDMVHTRSYYNELFTNLDGVDLSKSLRTAYRDFYLRPSYIFERLKRIKSIGSLKTELKSALAVMSFIFGND